MNSITFALLLVVLGCACAQQTDLKQQVLAAMDSRGLSETLRNMDEECRDITKDFLSSSIAELYPDYTMEQIELYLFATNFFGDFALDLEEFNLGISNVYLFTDRTLLKNGGCCQLLCEISKYACSCSEGNVEAWGRVLTNRAFLHPTSEFLYSIRELCKHENVHYKHGLRYPTWLGCYEGDDEWYYSNNEC